MAEAPTSELAKLIGEIQSKKGANAIRPARLLPRFNAISLGVFTLDFALLGGLPEGLASMIHGFESSGKTTIMMRAVAAIQRKYPWRTPLYIDAEQTFDKDWAEKQGVDIDNLQLVQPESGEDAVDIATAVMDAWETSMIVIDSVPAMVPMNIDKTSAEDKTMTELARLMGVFCSKILSSWGRERRRNHFVTVVFINQWRSKVGVIRGDPRVLPGGMQVTKFLPTTKIEIKNKEVLGTDKNGIEVVETNDHSFRIIKAKIGSSIRAGEFQMVVNPDHPLGSGKFLDAATVLVYAKKLGLLTGGGSSWYLLNVDRRFTRFSEIEDFLYLEEGEMLRLQQIIIAQQRIEKGLPALPPDGFLLDWNAAENLV